MGNRYEPEVSPKGCYDCGFVTTSRWELAEHLRQTGHKRPSTVKILLHGFKSELTAFRSDSRPAWIDWWLKWWPAIVGGVGMLVVMGGACTLSFNLKAEVTEARVVSASVRSYTTLDLVGPGPGGGGRVDEVTKTDCEAELVFLASNGQQIRFTKRYDDVIGCTGKIGRILPVAYDPANPLDHKLKGAIGLRAPIVALIVGVVMIIIAIAGFVAKLVFRSHT